MEICSNVNEVKHLIENQECFALYFSDGICGVAESLYPKLDDVFSSKYSNIKLKSVIGPMSPDIQSFLQVFTAPCFLLFIDGKETIRKAGNFSVVQLDKEINRIYNLRFY